MALCFVAGCDDDTFDWVGQLKRDKQIIRDYLSDNNLEADSTGSGLYYRIEEAGSGGSPNRFSTVTVFYKGSLLNGEVFDETGNDPRAISLSNTIQGWQEGIPLIEKGGKIHLYIPSILGYGEFGSGTIPGNTVIQFEIELLNF